MFKRWLANLEVGKDVSIQSDTLYATWGICVLQIFLKFWVFPIQINVIL